MSEKLTNEFEEPLVLPPTFRHPDAGKYKDHTEEFFLHCAVRIYVDVDIGSGLPGRIPVWLDVVRFEDQVVDGSPVRLGLGRVQKTVHKDLPGGLELSFHPEEVFHVIEYPKAPREPGGVEFTLAE
jgi:hypothetical protein